MEVPYFTPVVYNQPSNNGNLSMSFTEGLNTIFSTIIITLSIVSVFLIFFAIYQLYLRNKDKIMITTTTTSPVNVYDQET